MYPGNSWLFKAFIITPTLIDLRGGGMGTKIARRKKKHHSQLIPHLHNVSPEALLLTVAIRSSPPLWRKKAGFGYVETLLSFTTYWATRSLDNFVIS